MRVANWLHLNRGNRAWRYMADANAVVLLFPATGGLFMIGGKKGWRGAARCSWSSEQQMPAAYVVLSGGP